jgi:hypothetical protein
VTIQTTLRDKLKITFTKEMASCRKLTSANYSKIQAYLKKRLSLMESDLKQIQEKLLRFIILLPVSLLQM